MIVQRYTEILESDRNPSSSSHVTEFPVPIGNARVSARVAFIGYADAIHEVTP